MDHPATPLLGYTVKRNENIHVCTRTHARKRGGGREGEREDVNFHSIIIHNNQKVDTIQV